MPIDTADTASIDSAAQEVLAKHPDLNVLVTMAGIMRVEDWHKPEEFLASAESVVTTNVLGPIRLIAAFVQHLQAQPDATIVTVSSGLAFTPLKVTPSYNASKAAIHMLSESIRLQLADTTVKVVELEPPAVRTSLLPGQENSEFAMALDAVRGRGRRAAPGPARRPGDPGRTGQVPALRRGARRLRPGRRDAQCLGPARAIASEAQPALRARQTGTRMGGTVSAKEQGVRVLVVEDERRLAGAVQRGLQAEGFAVDLAFDGADGLHLAREGAYDAVVLDLMLPQLSGYQVCERLRAEENWVPVLILSAKDGEYDQADGLDLGADDYLTKPFSYIVLAAKLRALLRRGAAPRPAVLRAGDLSLDPASRIVRRGETDIDLTAREFAMLEYLIRRASQVVPKSELLDHVWDTSDSADLNVVEVYAGYIRRKIDAPFGRAALQTLRGAGYRLAADGG